MHWVSWLRGKLGCEEKNEESTVSYVDDLIDVENGHDGQEEFWV